MAAAAPSSNCARWQVSCPAEPADPGVCEPAEHHEPAPYEMLDELIAWSAALAPLRVAA